MARPHSALIDLVAARKPAPVKDHVVLLRSAIEHRVIGLLWRSIKEGDVDVPRETRKTVAALYLRNRDKNMRLWKTAEDAVSLLEEIGVEVALAKGVATESRWYGDPGERQCVDVDLLVAPQDVHRFEEVTSALSSAHPLQGSVGSLVAAGFLQSIDVASPSGVFLDIHADILKLGIPTRQVGVVWSRTEELSTPSGMRVRAMDAEMSLIIHLIHLNKDGFPELARYLDVVRIVDTAELDWGFIEHFLATEGLTTHAHLSLEAVYGDLGLSRSRITAASGLSSRMWRRLWGPETRLLGYPGYATGVRRHFVIPFMLPGRRREAVRWWWRRLFPPRALVEVYHRDITGPYVWRLLAGRTKDRLRTRRTRAELEASEISPPRGS